MKELVCNGKTIVFTCITGEVMAEKKWSETRITSSGGGGYVHPQHGGHISAPEVSSVVTTKTEFWLKTSSGEEKDVKLNDDIPLRAGQNITVVSAGLRNGKFSYYSIIVNHTAKKYWIIREGGSLNTLLKIVKFYNVIQMLLFIVLPLEGNRLLHIQHFPYYLALVGIFLFLRRFIKGVRAISAIDNRLKVIAQEALAQGAFSTEC
jgi:hypothetical protein